MDFQIFTAGPSSLRSSGLSTLDVVSIARFSWARPPGVLASRSSAFFCVFWEKLRKYFRVRSASQSLLWSKNHPICAAERLCRTTAALLFYEPFQSLLTNLLLSGRNIYIFARISVLDRVLTPLSLSNRQHYYYGFAGTYSSYRTTPS